MQEDISYVVYCPVENTNYNVVYCPVENTNYSYSDLCELTFFCYDDLTFDRIFVGLPSDLFQDFFQDNALSIGKYFDTSIEDADFLDTFRHLNYCTINNVNLDGEHVELNAALHLMCRIERNGDLVNIYANYTADINSSACLYEGCINLCINLSANPQAAITELFVENSYTINTDSSFDISDLKLFGDIPSHMLGDSFKCSKDSIEKYFDPSVEDEYFLEMQNNSNICFDGVFNFGSGGVESDINASVERNDNSARLRASYYSDINFWECSYDGDFDFYVNLDKNIISFNENSYYITRTFA